MTTPQVRGRSEAQGGTENKDHIASARYADRAKHKTGYNGKWEAEHPWLSYVHECPGNVLQALLQV